MTRPVVRVVGLGPGDQDLTTARTTRLIGAASVSRLRTRRHPGAAHLGDIASYDEWYEDATSFDDLYERIAEDLAGLASASPTREVLYIVPGSPVVAERTVELLRAREDVETVCEPAVSVVDLACAAMSRDPMDGLRVVDALGSAEPLRGPGPLLVLQCYAPEVLAGLAARLPAPTPVTVLHHLGLVDQRLVSVPAGELVGFADADELTSVWVDELRTPGAAIDDLVDLMRRLRHDCPWDQEQSHASLTRHLLEEAYEALDALEVLVRREADGSPVDTAVAHVEEELGDLLFQIVFHAELGAEEGRFDLATISDRVGAKLVGRHPHVFGDVAVSGSDEVASNWENLKRDEKGRASVTEGIAWQLPALTLYTKLVRKAVLVDLEGPGASSLVDAVAALRSIELSATPAPDAASTADVDPAWGDAMVAVVRAARWAGVDLEGVVRERSARLRDAIVAAESSSSPT